MTTTTDLEVFFAILSFVLCMFSHKVALSLKLPLYLFIPSCEGMELIVGQAHAAGWGQDSRTGL